MGHLDAADGIADLFGGRRTEQAHRAALLMAAVLLAHRPPMVEVVTDEPEGA